MIGHSAVQTEKYNVKETGECIHTDFPCFASKMTPRYVGKYRHSPMTESCPKFGILLHPYYLQCRHMYHHSGNVVIFITNYNEDQWLIPRSHFKTDFTKC